MLAWDDLVARSVITSPVGGWRPMAVAAAVEAVLSRASRRVDRRPLGESFEGRPIELLVVGDGPKRAMMWSQMHGDEPTHTSVLLNLLRLLLDPDSPAERLTRGLTIGMILPLNPDGAERSTRENAQGIDINRDALEFATPEGRLFRDAVLAFRPDYGFNLHNQGRRTAVGTPPLGPASVSLLVPPLDVADSQTDSVREANRVAATFCERVRDRVGGRVSRYDADFMARAFGEWVQRQGVPVILVEAGGWPEGLVKPLEEAHFAAFVQTLDAIAATALGEAGGLEACDPASYLGLPRSSPYAMHDLLLRVAGVGQLAAGDGVAAVGSSAVGVDFSTRMAGGELAGGVVAGLGDLHENGGLRVIDSAGVALPGRIVLAEPSDDAFDEAPADWERLTGKGTTTALVRLNLADEGLTARIAAIFHDALPINVGLVLGWDGPEQSADVLLERLTEAVGAGAVATIGPLPDRLVRACCHLGLPAIDPTTTPTVSDPLPATVAAWLAEARRVAEQLGWRDRGRIGRGLPADLALVAVGPDHAVAQDCLRTLLVGGTVVRDSGGLNHTSPGQRLAWAGPRV